MTSETGKNSRAPRISVVMGVYDGDHPSYLKAAIDSILSQTFADFEYIIVGDCISRTDLLEVLEEYQAKDQRLILVKNRVKRNLSYVLNTGIAMAKGEFIARMDADDIAVSTRLAKQAELLDHHREVDVCGSYIAEFTNEQELDKAFVVRYPLTHAEMKNIFAQRNPLAHPAVMMRKRFFDKAGMYPLFTDFNQDTLLWMSGFKSGAVFATVPEVLLYFRYNQGTAKRRIGVHLAYHLFLDRLLVISHLELPTWKLIYPLGMFALQLLPKTLFVAIRRNLIN